MLPNAKQGNVAFTVVQEDIPTNSQHTVNLIKKLYACTTKDTDYKSHTLPKTNSIEKFCG